MEEKEVIVENPIAIAGVTVIPVAKMSLNRWHGNRGFSFFGIKQPVGVVVVSPSAKRAFRTTGEEVSLDEFIKEVPDVKEVLEGI